MNKTLLIVIGIACAVFVAWVNIYFNPVNIARRNLDNPDPEKRVKALELLTCRLDRQSIPRIRQMLYDTNPKVHRFAGWALAEFGDRESLPAIRKFLEDKNSVVRSFTISIISEFKDQESIPALRKLIDDEDELLVIVLLHTLSELGDLESIPALRPFLENKNSEVRVHAIEALCQLNDQDQEIIIPILKKMLADDCENVVSAAERALRLRWVSKEEIQKAKEK